MHLRHSIRQEDISAIRALALATGVFYDFEIEIAIENAQVKLRDSNADEQHYIFAEDENGLLGYIALAYNGMTKSTYEPYWVMTQPALQGKGIGRALYAEAERFLRKAGATLWLAQTSSRAPFEGSRRLHVACGFESAAVIKDYYAPGDDQIIYRKALSL